MQENLGINIIKEFSDRSFWITNCISSQSYISFKSFSYIRADIFWRTLKQPTAAGLGHIQFTWFFKQESWTSLVPQWLRIHLSMQGTQVRSLVREDPACRRATKPVCHNYWARMPQLLKPGNWSPCSATREATAMRSPHTAVKSSPCSPQLEEAHAQQRRPNTAKDK